jgi:protein SCO1/2
MTKTPVDLMRRHLCAGAAAWAVTAAALGPRAYAGRVYADHGRVDPPVAVPDVPVRLAHGDPALLAELVRGHATALQLMFTGCSSVCPIQGAIFERVQTLLPDQCERGIQLLSLSIDPLSDTPPAMQAWLDRFGARKGWIAAAPQASDLNRLLDVFGQGRSAVESHATQVNIIDRRGELVFRTPELPSADSLADILRRVSQLSASVPQFR